MNFKSFQKFTPIVVALVVAQWKDASQKKMDYTCSVVLSSISLVCCEKGLRFFFSQSAAPAPIVVLWYHIFMN